MNVEEIKKQVKEFEEKNAQYIAEQYHAMLDQLPKEMQDHLRECRPCTKLSQQTVTKVFELINRHFLTLLGHMEKK